MRCPQTIITDFVFPLVCYSDADAELWEEDPYEYVRSKFGATPAVELSIDMVRRCLRGVYEPRDGGAAFCPHAGREARLCTCCSCVGELWPQGAHTLDIIMGFCHQVLVRELQTTPETRQPRQKA